MADVRLVGYVDSGSQAAGGRCYTCDRQTGGLVDMGVVIEGEGILFICRKCIGDAARAFGWCTPKQLSALEHAMDAAREELAKTREENTRLRELTVAQAGELKRKFSPSRKAEPADALA